MSRKMSKAAKADAYDALSARADLMECLLHDIALGREPDAVRSATEPSEHESDGVLEAEAKLFRVTGALGGIVLLHVYTRYLESPPSTSDVRAVRLDDLYQLAGGEGYFRSPWERALYQLAWQLKAVRDAAYEAERASR